MAPPQANPNWHKAEPETPAAVPFDVFILKNRADFLKASRAKRVVTPGFILQARKRQTHEPEGIRVGFTCSKKVGNAVARNRAKRRLREVARLLLPYVGMDGFDYVLVGRREATAQLPFDLLMRDFERAANSLRKTV